jgi:hypothetical protein
VLLATILSSLNFFLIPADATNSMYQQGFAKGIELADKNFKAAGPGTNHVNPSDLDCDSDVDPLENNPDYCNGVNDGYAHEANKLSGK